MSVASGSTAEDRLLEGLRNADSAESRLAYLDRHPSIVSRQSVEALADAVRHYVRVDVAIALRAGESAVAIAERLADPESMARALRAKGNAHWFEGDCRLAADLMKKAAVLFERQGRMDEVGRTLSTSIQPLILLGDYEAALGNAERAREIFTQLNDDLRLARLDINVANIHHRQERHAEALASYERAYQRLLPHRDAEGIGVALHNMAVCLISLDDFDQALKVYSKARTFLGENGMPRLVLQADYNIAYLYHLRGDYEKAIDLLGCTRESCAADDPYHAALCDLDLSEIYLELNLRDEASEKASRAAGRFERLGMRYEHARSITNLAISASRGRGTRRAIELFGRAKELFRAEGHAAGEALVNLYQASLLADAGELQQSKKLCSEAAEVFRRSDLLRKAVLCDLLLSRLALADGEVTLAGEQCRAAESRLESLESPLLNYQAWLQRGRICEVRQDDAGALAAYTAAAAELENMRCTIQGEELKIALVSNKLEVYERLTALALKEGLCGPPAERAFGYIERAKSRNLAESMVDRRRPLPAAGAEGAVTTRIRELREKLNWYYHRIQAEEISGNGVDPARIEQLWANARGRENELVELLREDRALTNRREGPGEPAAVPLSDVCAALEPGSVLVEYFQIGDQLLAGIVSRGGLVIVPLVPASAVRNRLRILQLHLAKSLLGQKYSNDNEIGVTAVERHLRVLYDELIAPLEAHLDCTHLILAPHGSLHYLPIHALHDGKQYLIDRFTISYAPSASIYSLCRRMAEPPGTGSLVLGIEDSRAPWISHEVREVASVLSGSRLFVGPDARLSALEQWGNESRLIHIATHGSFRTDNPLFSAVQLADCHLSVYDLYNLRLRAELLTLSGCATGLNVVAAGDELLGLVRGLLHAGARSLLLTLWDVHDRSTAEFMRLFYERLRDGGDKARALRGAILELRGRYPHPCYWAPFVLVGKIP